jgi:hypothetical protein
VEVCGGGPPEELPIAMLNSISGGRAGAVWYAAYQTEARRGAGRAAAVAEIITSLARQFFTLTRRKRNPADLLRVSVCLMRSGRSRAHILVCVRLPASADAEMLTL